MDITKAEHLAKALISKHLKSHGLWIFRFEDHHSCYIFGTCEFRQSAIIDRVSYPIPGGIITLSRVLTALNDQDAVVDTLLHEIAHALCGPNVIHGPIWKKTAVMIGCRAESCYDSTRLKLPPSRYIAECPNCGRQREYDKKRSISCGRCDNKFNPEYRMVFRENPNALQPASDKSPLAEMNTTTDLTYGNTEGGKT